MAERVCRRDFSAGPLDSMLRKDGEKKTINFSRRPLGSASVIKLVMGTVDFLSQGA